MANKSGISELKVLVFTLDGIQYGIDISMISSIIEKDMAVTRVPHTRDYITGVINLRGEIIPVLDLKKRLSGISCIQDTEETKIIVIRLQDIAAGLIVDSVTEVVTLHGDEIEDIEDITDGYDDNMAALISATGKKQGNVISILNAEDLIMQDIIQS